VERLGEERLGRGLLHYAAGIHDADPVVGLGDDPEVVADQHQRHAGVGPDPGQKLEDLGLDGGVERRRRLVGDEQVGLARERHGDHHALVLAA
jgi:hypothetical protein